MTVWLRSLVVIVTEFGHLRTSSDMGRAEGVGLTSKYAREVTLLPVGSHLTTPANLRCNHGTTGPK